MDDYRRGLLLAMRQPVAGLSTLAEAIERLAEVPDHLRPDYQMSLDAGEALGRKNLRRTIAALGDHDATSVLTRHD